jgi:hypothetical protein
MTQSFTFRSASFREVTVSEPDEATARHHAMYRLWGLPHGWCHNVGNGLHIIALDAVDLRREQGESDHAEG